MKKKHTLLECLFGYHRYSKILIVDKEGRSIHLCKICKRSARRKGQLLEKNTDRFEYDKKGNLVYIKWSDGDESCRDKNGDWVDRTFH